MDPSGPTLIHGYGGSEETESTVSPGLRMYLDKGTRKGWPV